MTRYSYGAEVMVEVRVGSNHSVLWAEGTRSRNTIASYLGQEISGAGYLQSETTSSGLTDMGIEASYSGQADSGLV